MNTYQLIFSHENLPAFFRFRPRDEELVIDYLNHKVLGNPLIPGTDQFIHTIENFNQLHPKDIIDGLNEDYFDEEKTEWYFFTEREFKYNNGSRPQRIAGNGYWKATGKDDIISYNGATVGFKKKLDYYEGHSRPGKKTDWKMHEYTTTITDQESSSKNKRSENIVLCKIYINQRITNSKKKRVVVSDDHIDDEDGGGVQEITATSIDISDQNSEQLPSTSRPLMTFDDVRNYKASCRNQERDDVVMNGSLTEGRGVGRSLIHAVNNELVDGTTDMETRLKRPLSTTDFDDLLSELELGNKRLKKPDLILQEIEEINQTNTEVAMNVIKAVDEEILITCCYNPVGFSFAADGDTKMLKFPTLLLELIVTADYPNTPPVVLETLPLDYSEDEEGKHMWMKAMLNFRWLRKWSTSLSLEEIATTWNVCAREVFHEFATQSGSRRLF